MTSTLMRSLRELNIKRKFVSSFQIDDFKFYILYLFLTHINARF